MNRNAGYKFMAEDVNEKDELNSSRPIITFVPEMWGEFERFHKFYGSTYRFNKFTTSALCGVHGHFDRYHVLLSLSKRLIPELEKDYEELIKNGNSDAIHSRELAAIVDSMFCELYSSVDCTRRVIVAIYGKYPGIGMDKKSTSGLFKNAGKHKIDDRVPLEIRGALEKGQSDWFPKLKKIRDAINHSSVGFCSDLTGRKNGELEPKISYSHQTLANELGNVHVTDDVFKMISELEVKVNLFQGSIYNALYQTLEDKETTQVCGWFDGRVYLRLVSPKEVIDFNSGRCYSRIYFDKGSMSTCPFMAICGAYKNSKSEDN
jgi:hypothetical protein